MDFSPISNYIESFVRTEKGVPACEVEIRKGHEVLFRYRSGHSDADGTKPLTGNELYNLYSCSKPMTCAAAMQLVEQGKLGLEDSVSRYLPEFAEPYMLKDEQRIPATKAMTIRHLFTMTAGLDYNLRTQHILSLIEENPHATTREIVSRIARAPISFEPGERFQYSLCHDVLAAVVEVVSGERSTGESTKAMVAGSPAVAAWSGGKCDASQARDQ